MWTVGQPLIPKLDKTPERLNSESARQMRLGANANISDVCFSGLLCQANALTTVLARSENGSGQCFDRDSSRNIKSNQPVLISLTPTGWLDFQFNFSKGTAKTMSYCVSLPIGFQSESKHFSVSGYCGQSSSGVPRLVGFRTLFFKVRVDRIRIGQVCCW
eukprot:sb/3472880/